MNRQWITRKIMNNTIHGEVSCYNTVMLLFWSYLNLKHWEKVSKHKIFPSGIFTKFQIDSVHVSHAFWLTRWKNWSILLWYILYLLNSLFIYRTKNFYCSSWELVECISCFVAYFKQAGWKFVACWVEEPVKVHSCMVLIY